MNVNLSNGWGVVRTIADLCLKQPEGKYVLLKDPNKVSYHYRSIISSLADIPTTSACDSFVPCSLRCLRLTRRGRG